MICQAVVFDLDGTLLDTLDDIAASANRVLAAHGFPIHATDEYRWFVGDGSALLMTRALPEDKRSEKTIKTCLQGFIADYNRNWDQATRPYDGISELLENLQRKGVKLSVVTNKPHRFTGIMMAKYFARINFGPVLGQQEGIPKKPDARQALAAAAQMGVSPPACIFTGDSAVDMQTALNAGMQPVGAGWGFRPAEELNQAGAAIVIAHPLALLDLID